MGKITVKQAENPADEVATEVIANAIVEIADGVRRIRSGRLNDRALFLLIQSATAGSVTIRDIKAVLDGIESLEATFLKKKAR